MIKPAMLAIGLAALTSLCTSAADYNIVSQNTTVFPLPAGTLTHTETVVQDGPDAINRFTMHRLTRSNTMRRGTLLLLPALGNNFRSYLSTPTGNINNSFAGYFVHRGYEVWGYSPRETGLQTGQCGVTIDCSPALNWSLQTIVDDVSFIRARIKLVTGKKPVIGGLSLGAISALAVVNQNPGDYAGLLAWEGSHVTGDPAIRAHNQVFCNQFRSLVSAGVPVEDQSLPFVKLVAQLAQTAPADPFVIPVPGFPPGLTNQQAFVFILSTPNPIAPSPVPGFISAAGDFTTGRLFHSSSERLAANIAEFNDVTANRVSRDLYCSLSGLVTTYSANLAQFTAPAMIIEAGLGFGPVMTELPNKLGSTSITFTGIHHFAHVDHMGAQNHTALLESPIAQWLGQVF